MSYIPVAIARLKGIPLESLVSLKLEGKKKVRIVLESPEAAKALGKEPATAIIPLYWIICAHEKMEDARTSAERDNAFKDFESDWISGWSTKNSDRRAA